MKYLRITYLIIFFVLIVLVSCGNKEENEPQNTTGEIESIKEIDESNLDEYLYIGQTYDEVIKILGEPDSEYEHNQLRWIQPNKDSIMVYFCKPYEDKDLYVVSKYGIWKSMANI